ncbi:hypothetical protein [Methylophaga sp. OBS1]|uniref:hypothetical protein n=1 Tax=Methylophaga sp. OBS1 TaxID=2991933 RepID=UPI00224D0492|nr:hypothetical protein [Methylophaga sp. OBS1]MCX4193875.1 hypothetical protein [Methylophaga sp. OBS1]
MNRTIPATVTAIVLAAVANWLADWRLSLLLLLSSLVVYLLVRAPANVTTLPVDAGDHQQTQAEVEQLSRETLSMVKQQLLLVDEENRQVARLVNHAISQLSDSFHAVSSQALQQQQILKNLESQTVLSQDTTDSVHEADTNLSQYQQKQRELSELRRTSQTMASLVNQAVTSMQFEDICSQLSTHINKRIDMITELAEINQILQQTAIQSGDVELSRQKLNSVRQQVATLAPKVAGIQHQSVTQKSMESGNIELF